MLTKISNEREYKAAMKKVESLLNKATKAGGEPADRSTAKNKTPLSGMVRIFLQH